MMFDIWDEIPDGLDASVLRTLASDTSFHVVGELLASFLSEMTQQVEAIQAACASEDVDTLSSICHTMKGLCATFGATRLGNLMQSVEMALRADEGDKVPAIVADMVTETADTKESILQVVSLIKEQDVQ